jgi:hypothetical protein
MPNCHEGVIMPDGCDDREEVNNDRNDDRAEMNNVELEASRDTDSLPAANNEVQSDGDSDAAVDFDEELPMETDKDSGGGAVTDLLSEALSSTERTSNTVHYNNKGIGDATMDATAENRQLNNTQ